MQFCVADCAWFAVSEPTECQRLRNHIDAAMIFARADSVNMHSGWRSD